MRASAKIIFALFIAATAMFSSAFAQTIEHVKEACPRGMVKIPGGEFVMGVSELESRYLFTLCKQTMGGCYISWFQRETPRESVYVPPFCIDRFEFPNKAGQKPETGATWERAKSACREQQKNLCWEHQWERVCAGPANFVWSYGNSYVEGECNIRTGAIEPSGSRKRCASLEGVNDLNGNVAEWVYARPGVDTERPRPEGGRLLKGGNHRDWTVFTRCSYRDFRAIGDAGKENGFRCCSPLLEDEETNQLSE